MCCVKNRFFIGQSCNFHIVAHSVRIKKLAGSPNTKCTHKCASISLPIRHLTRTHVLISSNSLILNFQIILHVAGVMLVSTDMSINRCFESCGWKLLLLYVIGLGYFILFFALGHVFRELQKLDCNGQTADKRVQ